MWERNRRGGEWDGVGGGQCLWGEVDGSEGKLCSALSHMHGNFLLGHVSADTFVVGSFRKKSQIDWLASFSFDTFLR